MTWTASTGFCPDDGRRMRLALTPRTAYPRDDGIQRPQAPPRMGR